jgi:diacylglycerol kinase family enzyme
MNPRPPALLVVNPAARNVSASREDPVVGALSRGFAVEIAETKRPGHATELAASAVEDELGLVIVLGGDGTANEVANGLADTGTSMAVLPGGQANILARALGQGRDPIAAARALAGRAGEEPEHIPLGRIDDRWFVSNCGVGFDAAIVRDVERHPNAKRRAGDWFFLWIGLRIFASGYDRRSPQLDLSWGPDLEHHADGVFLAVVQNLSPYTFFGRRPMRLCPDASLHGGLDVLAMDSFGAGQVLPVAVSSFARARHPARAHVQVVHDQRRVHVRCRTPMPAQADGEYLGERDGVEIRSIPAALSVLR